MLWTGGLALLAATAIDTFAVIGRHIGLPVHGSIEMMQAVVLVSGVIAMIVATIENAHARVKLVVDRLSPRRRALADRLSDFLTLLLFASLLAGSSWIAWDLRDAYEQSELLGIPWMLLRVIVGLVLLATCGVLTIRVFRGARVRRDELSGGTASNSAVHGE
nr:TRAP transporter small permease subunit [Altericroceibacterium endophyticum]